MKKPGQPGRRRHEHPKTQARPLSEAVRALPSPAGPARRSRPSASPSVRRPDLPDPFEGLVTPQEAAELFAVTKRTIRNWRRDGVIAPVRGPKRRIYYRLEDLLGLIEDGKPSRPKSN